MTNLQILKNDLETHRARREQLSENKGGAFIRREGYPVEGVIASYDTIIASIEAEIDEIEGRKKTLKKAEAKPKKAPKKAEVKKTPKKKKATK